MRAVYCKCTNTYSIKCAEDNMKKECNAPDYWKQGIGRIYKKETQFLQKENSSFILKENNDKILK